MKCEWRSWLCIVLSIHAESEALTANSGRPQETYMMLEKPLYTSSLVIWPLHHALSRLGTDFACCLL